MLFAAVKFYVRNIALALTLYMAQRLAMYILPVLTLDGSKVVQPMTPTHKGDMQTLIATMEYSISRSHLTQEATGISTLEFSSKLL